MRLVLTASRASGRGRGSAIAARRRLGTRPRAFRGRNHDDGSLEQRQSEELRRAGFRRTLKSFGTCSTTPAIRRWWGRNRAYLEQEHLSLAQYTLAPRSVRQPTRCASPQRGNSSTPGWKSPAVAESSPAGRPSIRPCAVAGSSWTACVKSI